MAVPLVHPLTKFVGPTMALQEILYGLVMALGTVSTVSIGIGLGAGSQATLILAALGVNLTWGMADMLIYITTKNFERMRHYRLAEAIRQDDEGDWPIEAIENDLSETIVATLDPADQERIYLDILDSEGEAPDRIQKLQAGHYYGGVFCLVLTVLAALPVIVPLVLLSPLELGLRVASVVAIVLLFLVGYLWAPYAGMSPWRTGAGMMGIGGLIALATLFLSG